MDGRLCVAGGWDGSNYRSEVEVYDPADGSWSSLPDMPTARFDPSVFSIGGLLYVYGGHDQNGWVDRLEWYDPDLSAPGPYRASDHDPVIMSLKIN